MMLRLVVIASLLLAAGCSTGPEKPGTISPATPTTPAVTSASPTPTETPVETQVETAMKAYLAAANDAFKSGNTSRLEDLSDKRCPCRATARNLRRVYASGGRYEGAQYEVKKLNVHDVAGTTALVEVSADVSPYKIIDGSGKVTENSAGGQLHTDFSLVVKEGSWIVANSFDLG